jgi:hypothetical protein
MEKLIAVCDGLTLEQAVREAGVLRRELAAMQHPATLAETLADRYRGGVTAEDVQFADRLRDTADATTLEALKAFYDAVNRDEPRVGIPVPYRYREALAAAWFLVYCELGRPCQGEHRDYLELCAARGVCGVESTRHFLDETLPEGEIVRALAYRDQILGHLQRREYAALGLSVTLPTGFEVR